VRALSTASSPTQASMTATAVDERKAPLVIRATIPETLGPLRMLYRRAWKVNPANFAGTAF
jgi:hypothetical protein